MNLLNFNRGNDLFSKAYAPLLDTSLPESETETIKSIILQHCSGNISFHDLRTRKAGNYKYIDFHLNLDENLTVKEAHKICDRIEQDLKSNLKNTEVTIHVENF